MKTLLLVSIGLICGLDVCGQPPKRYDTCAFIGQYQGEWRYENGSDTVRIYLRVHKYYSHDIRVVTQTLIGWHEYKQGNVVIESDYSHRFDPLTYNWDTDTTKFSIMLSLDQCSNSCLALNGSIVDLLQSDEIKDVKAILDSGKTQMSWTQKHGEGVGMVSHAHGMTLPPQFALIKQ